MSDIDRRRGKYVARWRDPDGRQRSRSFNRAGDARRWLAEVEASLARGVYVDHAAGKLTLGEYAAGWLAAQTCDPSSREALASRWNSHILPGLGDVPLAQIRASTVQAFVAGLQRAGLAPGYIRTIKVTLSAALKAAVEDRLIPSNPAATVRAPRIPDRRLVLPTPAQVATIRAALPLHYAATVDVGNGLGLRQGECFGLMRDDIEWLGRSPMVHVRRQVRIVGGRTSFGPPKNQRERSVPLPESVAVALSEHIPPNSEGLIFTSARGGPVNKNSFNHAWRDAVAAAGLPAGRASGFHMLRHNYASTLLAAGVDPVAVADALGHSVAVLLSTYAHLMPSGSDRIRAAVDAAAECAPEVRADIGAADV